MSRLPAKYQLRTRLDQQEAVQAVAEATREVFDVFGLAQVCADLGLPATVELPQSGTTMYHGRSERDFSGVQSVAGARKGNPYNDLFARITINADDLSWECTIDLRTYSLWFSPAALTALIDRLLGISAETGEIRQLRHELNQERIARQSLEVELTALREKPLEPRERASFERLLYVLACGAKFQLKKPYSDGEAIIRSAAILGVKVPGNDTIASFLKAAKARAESERES